MITDQQVQLLRFSMTKYSNQKIAAAKSGMSERSARKYLKTKTLPSELKKERHWRTRSNIFAPVWDKIENMLVLSPGLTAKTILSYLISQHPREFQISNLRALQRQIQLWRSSYGPDKEVMFPQEIRPGRQSQSDYTHMDSLGVTIAGKAFSHLLFHFMLPYSRWEDASVCFTESFDSLTAGYEQAVCKLGKQAPEHRTDNQSAVSTRIKGKMVFTERWQEFMKHYGVVPTCNNPGKGHENGSVEKSHDLLKKAIDQELLLRGTRNFNSQTEYEDFVKTIVSGRNKARSALLSEEIELLQDLPSCKYNAPVLALVKVSSASTVRIQGGIYSVPSRLIGYQLKACIYRSSIELYYGRRCIQKMPKLASGQAHAINYRHIITQLIRKPGAFEDYKYRDCLFPRVIFRKTYDVYKKVYPSRGHKLYLKILQLAALHGENIVSQILEKEFALGKCPSLEKIANQLTVKQEACPEVKVSIIELKLYDTLVQRLFQGASS
ncbi:MAG: IS21 family transposase [Rickettsiaceae bacterium]